jgi:hypothetical protein
VFHNGNRFQNWKKNAPVVFIKVKINRIWKFNPTDMTVDIDFVLVLDWIDESLTLAGEYPDLEYDHFSPVCTAGCDCASESLRADVHTTFRLIELHR